MTEDVVSKEVFLVELEEPGAGMAPTAALELTRGVDIDIYIYI
jgi:hypothetical protein